jgi:hypothetical protein
MPSGLKEAIKKCATAGKKVTLAFEGGNNWGNYIWNNFPCLDFVKKRGQNPNNPAIPIKVPVPYEPKYILKVSEIISGLADALKRDSWIWDCIENVKPTGANEETSEICFTGADFTSAQTLEIAYRVAAGKWIDAEYTCDRAVNSCNTFIDIVADNFAGKTIIQPYKPVLNSYPCVDRSGMICPPELRADLKEDVISYGMTKQNFKPQYTAFTLTAHIPAHTKYIQLNRSLLGHGKQSLEYFTTVMELAKPYEYLEIFADNIRFYPSLFTKK